MEEKIKKERKKKRQVKDFFLLPMLYAILIVFAGDLLGSGIIGIPVGILNGILSSVNPNLVFINNDVWVTSQMYLTFIGIWILALAVLAIFKWNRPILKSLTHKMSGNNIKMLLLGLAIGGGLNLFCALIACLHKDIALHFGSIKPMALIYVFICVFIQSSAEELICRGFLYQRLRRGYKNPWVAILLNAALFGVLHLMNPGVTVLSVLNILLCGIMFSLMVYYMDSIWCAFAAHAAWNYMQNIILGLPNSGNVVPFSIFKLDAATNSFAYNVGFGIEGTVVADIVLAIVIVILIVWGEKKGKKNNIWE